MSLLEVSGLTIRYGSRAIVSDLSFTVGASEAVGLVGESGSGKTQTALAIVGLTPPNADIGGSILLDGTDMLRADEKARNRIRAEQVGMVFQDPMQALNPYMRIGDQMRRILLQHGLADGRGADRRVIEMLGKVGLPDPQRQSRAYPHQLSGGMRQRAMIASALIAAPRLLIADEPTTALDVTVQAQILDLLERLREDTALLMITHDLAIIAGHCERLLVMDDGRLIESGPTRSVFSDPAAPRTAELIAAAPDFHATPAPAQVSGDTTLQASDIDVSYRIDGDRRVLHAVKDFDMQVQAGETLAVVGESGSGKSSLVRALLGLIPARAGRIFFRSDELVDDVAARPAAQRRNLQMVFQDPVASLNPQSRVSRIIAEPLRVHEPELSAAARRERVLQMLDRVDLHEEIANRFAHELSGGQAQRVAIARALVVNPAVLICDEAVAALDGSVRRQILDLLWREQQDTGLSIVFISHDLAVVRAISHRVLVMYMGRLVELADNATLFNTPRHPYTKALLDAVAVPNPLAPGGKPTLAGEVPSVLDPPAGCAFHPRCRLAVSRCQSELPRGRQLGASLVACHRAEEIAADSEVSAAGSD